MSETYKSKSSEQANLTLNSILDLIVEGTWDWNANTGHVVRSPGWYRMLGYEEGVFKEDVFTWENIIHPDDYPMVMDHFEKYTAGKIKSYQLEYRCKKSDGTFLWIEDRGKIIQRNEDGSVARMIGAHLNIHEKKMALSELVKKNQLLQEGNLSFEKLLEAKNKELEKKNSLLEKKIQEVEKLSIIDPLTNIYNRRYFQHLIETEAARANRYNHSLSLSLFDIDYFKNINDKYGHKIGDTVLSQMAKLVRNNLRTNDSIARWGGEEFVLIMPETSLEQAQDVTDKLRLLINQVEYAQDLFITCSFGVTEFKHNESIETFFSRVDEGLYLAKGLGRNRVELVK